MKSNCVKVSSLLEEEMKDSILLLKFKYAKVVKEKIQLAKVIAKLKIIEFNLLK